MSMSMGIILVAIGIITIAFMRSRRNVKTVAQKQPVGHVVFVDSDYNAAEERHQSVALAKSAEPAGTQSEVKPPRRALFPQLISSLKLFSGPRTAKGPKADRLSPPASLPKSKPPKAARTSIITLITGALRQRKTAAPQQPNVGEPASAIFETSDEQIETPSEIITPLEEPVRQDEEEHAESVESTERDQTPPPIEPELEPEASLQDDSAEETKSVLEQPREPIEPLTLKEAPAVADVHLSLPDEEPMLNDEHPASEKSEVRFTLDDDEDDEPLDFSGTSPLSDTERQQLRDEIDDRIKAGETFEQAKTPEEEAAAPIYEWLAFAGESSKTMDDEARRRTIIMLSELREPWCVQPLVDALGEEKPDGLRLLALQALVKISHGPELRDIYMWVLDLPNLTIEERALATKSLEDLKATA